MWPKLKVLFQSVLQAATTGWCKCAFEMKNYYICFPFLDSDTWVAKSPAFDGNNLNESCLSNGFQVVAFKNLSDYICIHCLILEKTIPLWDQWKSRPWHLGSSRNVLYCDNISFNWQERAQLCVLGTETTAFWDF